MDGPQLMRRGFLAACAGTGFVALLRGDGAGARAARRGDHLAATELQLAAQRAGWCGSSNAAGVGLRGEYFANERCSGKPLLVRMDGSIDFDASLDWPAQHGANRPRSARWSGWIKPPVTGHYRFHADMPDARVRVAKELLVDAGTPASGGIDLAAGRYYPIVMELGRVSAASERIRLEWTAPHGARFLIPRALLYLPSDAVAPPRA